MTTNSIGLWIILNERNVSYTYYFDDNTEYFRTSSLLANR